MKASRTSSTWSELPLTSQSYIFLRRQNRIFFASILQNRNFSPFSDVVWEYFFTLHGKYPERETYFYNHQSEPVFCQSIRHKTWVWFTCALAHATFPALSTSYTFFRAYHSLLVFPRLPSVTRFPAVDGSYIFLPPLLTATWHYIFVFDKALKAKFIRQPCVLPVACPAALCDLCLLFVCLWPVHQPSSYDFQRPEKQHHPKEKINASLSFNSKAFTGKT